jgi:uncharacterized phosphosugar-binding protein
MYEAYLAALAKLPQALLEANVDALPQAADAAKDSIGQGRACFVFGSGHSVLPCMDLFPRYGGYTGFVPMMDPRLMWTSATAPGGAEEVLWLERQEGYASEFVLGHYPIQAPDTVVVVSHGGVNAAPVEVALGAKEKGATVVAVTSLDHAKTSTAAHSSGQRLADIAHIVLDNGVDAKDAQVDVPGVPYPVGGLSTVGAMAVLHCLAVETAARLSAAGHLVTPFVSPNVPGVPSDHSARVYATFKAFLRAL